MLPSNRIGKVGIHGRGPPPNEKKKHHEAMAMGMLSGYNKPIAMSGHGAVAMAVLWEL